MGNLFKKENAGQLMLAIVFIIYLIMGYQTPEPLASAVDTLWGKVIVAVIALSLFAISNPIVGVLGLLVAFDLIRRSGLATGNTALGRYVPSEVQKFGQLTAFNQFPYTLEQEVVAKMTPPVSRADLINSPATFKPMLDRGYDAAPVF